MSEEGWKREAQQLRERLEELNQKMADIWPLVDELIGDDVKAAKKVSGLPFLCLALHHFGMAHGHGGSRKAEKVMMAGPSVTELPVSFGDFRTIAQRSAGVVQGKRLPSKAK